MSLSADDRERLADVVELQPTKNGELQERWGMESGSEVHQYLESVLSEYYYRDDDSLIRATDDAVDLVDVAPGVEGDGDGLIVRVPALERAILDVLAGPDESSMSVVAVLHAVRAHAELDPDVDAVREGLNRLRRKGVATVEYRMVPTYQLARPRTEITVEPGASA